MSNACHGEGIYPFLESHDLFLFTYLTFFLSPRKKTLLSPSKFFAYSFGPFPLEFCMALTSYSKRLE